MSEDWDRRQENSRARRKGLLFVPRSPRSASLRPPVEEARRRSGQEARGSDQVRSSDLEARRVDQEPRSSEFEAGKGAELIVGKGAELIVGTDSEAGSRRTSSKEDWREKDLESRGSEEADFKSETEASRGETFHSRVP